MDSRDAIRLRGVRQNNLKNIDLDIPLGHLVVVTVEHAHGPGVARPSTAAE